MALTGAMLLPKGDVWRYFWLLVLEDAPDIKLGMLLSTPQCPGLLPIGPAVRMRGRPR